MKSKWFPEAGVLAALFMLGVGIYANSFSNSFHYDDIHHIVKNPHIRSLNNIPSFFTDPETFSTQSESHQHYRPFLMLTYAVNYYFGALDPAGYHLVNLIFHIGSAFLLFLIVKIMLSKGGFGGRGDSPFFPALAAGLLFLTTPFNSEVVNYVSARSSVMSTFFYLLAFYCWIGYRENLPLSPPLVKEGKEGLGERGGSRWIYGIASLLAFLMAMLSKEIAITLPVMLLLYDMFFLERGKGFVNGKKALRHFYSLYLVLFGIGISYLLVRKLFYGAAVALHYREGFIDHLLKEFQVWGAYIRLWTFPAGLSAVHNITLTVSISSIGTILSFLFLAGIGALAYYLYRNGQKSWRVASFFTLWFFITLIPTSIIPLVAVLQENRGYLPGVAFAVIAAVVIERVPLLSGNKGGRPRPLSFVMTLIVLGGIIFSFSLAVVERNQVWRNDVSLWSDVVKKYPRSGQAYVALGLAYYDSGNMEAALQAYQTANGLGYSTSNLYLNLGALYQKTGRRLEAEELYKKVLEADPSAVSAYINLGIIYREEKKMELSEESYQRALRIKPENIPAHVGLAQTYLVQKKFPLAAQEYVEVLKIDPTNLGIRNNLGLIYIKMGELDLAKKAFQKALEFNPEYQYARINMGLVEKIESQNK